MAIEFEIEDRKVDDERTSSPSGVRSTSSPRRSSSSACRHPIDAGRSNLVVDLSARRRSSTPRASAC